MKTLISSAFMVVLLLCTASFSYGEDNFFSAFPSIWDQGGTGTGFNTGLSNLQRNHPNAVDAFLPPGFSRRFSSYGDDYGSRFDAFFAGFLEDTRAPRQNLISPFDISNMNGHFVIETHVPPGTGQDEIGVFVRDDVLSVQIEKVEVIEEINEESSRFEYHHESYTRSAQLPAEVDSGEMDTQYEDGQVTVILPRNE